MTFIDGAGAIKLFQISPYVNDFKILKPRRKEIYFTDIYSFLKFYLISRT